MAAGVRTAAPVCARTGRVEILDPLRGLAALAGCGVAATVSALATVAVIVGSRNLGMPRWLSPLVLAGTISYALYLVHLPLGGRVINLAARLPSTALNRSVALAAAYAVSIVAATILWRFADRRRR